MNLTRWIIAAQLLYLTTTTNATSARCADEGETCRCHGEVVYGKKFLSGKSGTIAKLEEVLASGTYTTKWASGELACDNGTFGDPAFGFPKSCHCNEVPEGAVLGGDCGESADCSGDLVCSKSSLTCVEGFTVVFFSDLENHYRNFEDRHAYGFVKNLINLKDRDLHFDGDFQGKQIDTQMLLHGGDLSRDRWASYWRPRIHKIDNAQVTIDEEFQKVWDQTYEAGIPTLSTYGNHDYSGGAVPHGAMVNADEFPWKKIAEDKRCKGEMIDLGALHEIGSCARECVRRDFRTKYFGVSRIMDPVKGNHYPCKCYLEPISNGGTCDWEDISGHPTLRDDLFEIEGWYERAAKNKMCKGDATFKTKKPSLAACAGFCVRLSAAAFSFADSEFLKFGSEFCDEGSGDDGTNCECVCHINSSHPGKCDEGEEDDKWHHLYRITNYKTSMGAPTKDIHNVNVGLDYDWSKEEQHHDNLMTQDLVRRTFEKSAKLGLQYKMVKPDGEFGPVDFVAEYRGVQIIMFGTNPWEESYNKDGDNYTGLPATEQLERLKGVVDYGMPTLMVSHFPIAIWTSIYGGERKSEFKKFACAFEHITYFDGHTHNRAIHGHICSSEGQIGRFQEYTAPYRSGSQSGALAVLVSPQDGVLQVKFVPVNERVEGDENACIPEGGRCLAGTTCNDCCLTSNGKKLEYTWWHGLVGHGCGVEPKWGDGTRCLAGTSCNQCRNEYTWWYSINGGIAGHACGEEPPYDDGTKCLAGTSCNRCKNGYTWWHKYPAHACGEDKHLWGDGTRCLAGTSCNQCKNGYEWWETIFGHACGKEPCWTENKLCGYGTTCKRCCLGHKECPWYQFGVCQCK